MPRPQKCRRVCHLPPASAFYPGREQTAEAVVLTVDEYETIRLMDREGLSQEQCSARMQIARTTVQKIYGSARRKLAQMLTDGLALRIEGGEYRLCRGAEPTCTVHDCYKQFDTQPKGENSMRIAVTYENGQIFQHFGHTQQFKLYDVQDGKVLAAQVISTGGSGHGALAGLLQALQVEVLICGGIGAGAQNALAQAGIRLFGGASGDADAAVNALLAGSLAYDPNARCDHHGEHHHEQGHTCGSHGCGEHACH